MSLFTGFSFVLGLTATTANADDLELFPRQEVITSETVQQLQGTITQARVMEIDLAMSQRYHQRMSAMYAALYLGFLDDETGGNASFNFDGTHVEIGRVVHMLERYVEELSARDVEDLERLSALREELPDGVELQTPLLYAVWQESYESLMSRLDE